MGKRCHYFFFKSIKNNILVDVHKPRTLKRLDMGKEGIQVSMKIVYYIILKMISFPKTKKH